ncbi:MAG: GH92 family glycosyl hydrolase [Bacteroidia bacterium]|nr:GH92 family glycosyl hydrolase [Bacteroidia bacterium]MCZ2249763.1 GH92 family glycosyl hydrolase [Bacteroidia bacterium]
MRYIISITLNLIIGTYFCYAQKTGNTPIKAEKKVANYTRFVNPFVGTAGHGHTYPGATVPFGMVQLSPDTRIDGSWDGCSGYHYSDSIIYAFSHTHLSGTGCSDYGDIGIMPVNNQKVSYNLNSYKASYKHSNEKAVAGYYSVTLDNNIKAEFTASTRVGFHEYSFAPGDKQQIVIDLEHRDKALDYYFKIVNDTVIEGYRISESWAKKQELYFYILLDQPFINKEWLLHDSVKPNPALRNIEINSGRFGKLLISFNNKRGKVKIKVALSSVNTAGAKKNMLSEIPHWNFEKTRNEAAEMWNKELSKIEIFTSDINQKKVFYTALYHSMLQPNIYNDADGLYRGRDGKVHQAKDFNYYTVFSLWDTFRAWHPLMTIIDRKRTLDFIKTFLAQYEQGGLLPVWELSCNETECMIGYHSVSVIADALTKGISDFNIEKAFEAMKKSAESKQRFGLGAYIKNGALSIEDESESVSKTLEYAYDDWCIAQVAKYLNRQGDYNNYIQRAQSWKNLFDHETLFIRPKKNGNFKSPFDPKEVNNNFTEANAWQYTFFVPHDINGLTQAFKGKAGLEKKIDELFSQSSKTTGRQQVDITGLIGQYAHGNEPSHHIAFLYNTVDKPNKTTDKVHKILREFYTNQPDGLIGNEDCGQMSAWYVLSAMGLYQICPGDPIYEFNTPLFERVIIHLENGKSLIIVDNEPKNHKSYLKNIKSSLKINNQQINYEELIKGGVIKYYTTNTADSAMAYTRVYASTDSINQIVVNPLIISSDNPFIQQTQIKMTAAADAKIYYTTDNSEPTLESNLFTQPFNIDKSTTIKAIAVAGNKASKTVTADIHQLPHPDWKIKIESHYNPQYTAGGNTGIIDGLYGDLDWRKGGWQGYQAADFNATIEFPNEIEINKVSANFLQDTRSWIIYPKNITFEYSNDGTKFFILGQINNELPAENYEVSTHKFTKEFNPTKVKYLRVKAINYGTLPKWHQGTGGEAFIFIDEISVE